MKSLLLVLVLAVSTVASAGNLNSEITTLRRLEQSLNDPSLNTENTVRLINETAKLGLSQHPRVRGIVIRMLAPFTRSYEGRFADAAIDGIHFTASAGPANRDITTFAILALQPASQMLNAETARRARRTIFELRGSLVSAIADNVVGAVWEQTARMQNHLMRRGQ